MFHHEINEEPHLWILQFLMRIQTAENRRHGWRLGQDLDKLAARLANGATMAISLSKRLLNGSLDQDRNAAFLAEAVHVVGKKRWNRRGAMVTDRYQHVRHHPTVEDFVEWCKTAGEDGSALPIIAIDNVPGCKKIEEYPLPENCVLLFGQEGPGLSEAAIESSEVVLEISQFGSTRSINASAAAAITMHQWVMQHVFGHKFN